MNNEGLRSAARRSAPNPLAARSVCRRAAAGRRPLGWRLHLRGAALAVLALTALVVAQSGEPSVKIVYPPAGSYVSGILTVRVEVRNPPAGPVRVAIYADGKLICSLDRPPWECAWDAGDAVSEHQIRAVATVAGGQRLVATIRTTDAGYTERTDVDAVQVTVSVTDESGASVSGLHQNQFRIYEDDVPQKIEYFAAGNAALEVAAALDVSGSMTPSMLQLKRSVTAFLGALRPEDKVTLLAFNDNIFALTRASTDPTVRQKAVDRLAAWGGTALYDVTVKAVDMLGRQRGRRALVIFTDGEDTASRTTLPFVERRLERSDAVLFTIGQGRGTRDLALREILERLARKSGGRAFFTEDIDRLSDAFNSILDELAHQYLLSYTPPSTRHDGVWRRIKVQVTDKSYTVRAREGYRAASGSTR
ncbi:MAG TPA: VWA domain-containing protein [Vicinamibacterales bacterium]|jgi:Ca-activated chloride channel family protein